MLALEPDPGIRTGRAGGKASPRALLDVVKDEAGKWKCGILEACFGRLLLPYPRFLQPMRVLHKGARVPAVVEVNDRSSHF